MATARYLRTDEQEEAVRSLEWAEVQANLIATDCYLWKWVLISLHNAVQGFMVLGLWNGNGLLSLTPKAAEKWLIAYNNGKPFPVDKLDNFLNLYNKIKDPNNFNTFGSSHFIPSNHDASFKYLNDFRNEFIHFTPKGWSLELAGLPQICLDILDLIQFLGWNTTAILWHKQTLPKRAKKAHKKLRLLLLELKSQYSN